MNAVLPSAADGRVVLFPATRRDGEAICSFLDREDVSCIVCSSVAQVTEELEKGAATLVLTDSALSDPGGRGIVAKLQQQPTWSDLPVVLLGRAGTTAEVEQLIGRMTNVTVLERPTTSRSLLSAIHTSLRARSRQYQMRDQLAALVDAENALRVADRRKDEFLAMLAHELRNPLAPIRTASDLLPQLVPAGDERVDSTLRVVRRQVRQLARLVDDLLDVSRITHGRIELQLDVIDLASVVAEAIETVDPLVEEKGQSLTRTDPMPSLNVRGDRARLVQCVSNILTNASKYTDRGGRIAVSLQPAGESALITVRDDGIGMSPELLPTIFDLFVQSQRSLDRAQGGLGIGLSVVRRLIEMHGGTVSAHSPGAAQGSTFEIRLPLVAGEALASKPDTTPASSARRVLLVDDNRDAAESLSLLLQLSGHEVRTAFNGEEGLRIAESWTPDLVLLDIGLPGMNGYDVGKTLRARGLKARLIALTGYGQPDDVRRTAAAGFDLHMVKPVDVDRLLAALEAE